MRDWLLNLKLPPQVARNPWAIKAWERALADPTPGKIYSFYWMAGGDRYLTRWAHE